LIWDKSGLAAKNGLHVFAGVIDSSYRGEIGVVLKNFGEEDFKVEKNSKIAQMLIQPVVSANITEHDSLEDTERGEGGFGSTGLV
jgi:dUTP pyrophosphatase